MKNILLIILALSLSCVGYDAQHYDEVNQCWEPYESIEPVFSVSRSCEGSTTFAIWKTGVKKFPPLPIFFSYGERTPPDELIFSRDCE